MLADHGLRKTAFRKELLSVFLSHTGKAITNEMIEEALGDHDRITLYRTLKSFEDRGIIHIAMDGNAHARYALCGQSCGADHHHDAHAHFHCDQCGNTTCLEDMPERFEKYVPQGYQVNEIQVTFSGVCTQCA